MAPKFGVVQEDYFYDLEWTPGMDTSFIDILLNEKLIGTFVPYSSNEESLAAAAKRINASFGKNFTVSYMKYRLEILMKRHNTFSTLIRKHGVRYDEETNVLHASDNTWYELFRWEEFTLAYLEKGDPSWVDLKALFHIEQPYVPPVELHIISDDDAGDVGKNVRVPKKSTANNGKAKEVIILDDDKPVMKKSRLLPYPLRTDIPARRQPPHPSYYMSSSYHPQRREASVHSETGSNSSSVNQASPVKSSGTTRARPSSDNSIPTACSVFPGHHTFD